MLNKLLVVFALLAIVSCKAKNQVVVNKKNADSTAVRTPAANKLNAIKASQLNFSSFSVRAKAQLNIIGSSNNVTLTIRIYNGK